jgi:protein involved in temperature-dependent protein secretion
MSTVYHALWPCESTRRKPLSNKRIPEILNRPPPIDFQAKNTCHGTNDDDSHRAVQGTDQYLVLGYVYDCIQEYMCTLAYI